MRIRLLQSLSFFMLSVSWLVWLITGKQPDTFVTAMFVTLGAVLTIGLIELGIRTYKFAAGI